MKTVVAALALLLAGSGVQAQTPYPAQQGGYPGAHMGQGGYPPGARMGQGGYPGAHMGWGGRGSAPALRSPGEPDEVVRVGIDRLTGFLLGAPVRTPEALEAFLDAEIVPHFDFAYMARWAGGPLYRRLTDAQRARLEAELRSLFLGALVQTLGTFSHPLPAVQVTSARRTGDPRESIVPVRVRFSDGMALRANFRCYWNGTRWRVFDVSAEGQSAVAYYRRYFGDLLRRHGPEVLGP